MFRFYNKFNRLEENYPEKPALLPERFMFSSYELCKILFDVLLGTYSGFPCVGVIYPFMKKSRLKKRQSSFCNAWRRNKSVEHMFLTDCMSALSSKYCD